MISDIELEKTVLGGMISSPDYLFEIDKYLDVDLFTDPLHRLIASKIIEFNKEGKDYNMITLAHAIEGVTPYEITSIATANVCPDVKNCALLYDLKVKRDLFVIASRVASKAQSKIEDPYEILTEMQKDIEGLYVLGSTDAKTMLDACNDLHKIVTTNQDPNNSTKGEELHLSKLNKVMRLTGGELTVVAGESQMGKTALALNFLQHVAGQGVVSGMFSMEMTSSLLASRLVSRESGVNGFRILRRPLDSTELEKFDKGVGKVMNLPIYIDENSCNTSTSIANTVRLWVKKYGIKGFVVDYLQMMKTVGHSNEQGLADIVRDLKNVCVEQNVWCVLLSQLNRNMEYPVPTLTRLRGSGQIEEGADNVILLYRPDKYKTLDLKFPNEWGHLDTENRAWIHLAKNRNGEQIDFVCNWNGSTTSFSDLDESILVEASSKQEAINKYERSKDPFSDLPPQQDSSCFKQNNPLDNLPF